MILILNVKQNITNCESSNEVQGAFEISCMGIYSKYTTEPKIFFASSMKNTLPWKLHLLLIHVFLIWLKYFWSSADIPEISQASVQYHFILIEICYSISKA